MHVQELKESEEFQQQKEPRESKNSKICLNNCFYWYFDDQHPPVQNDYYSANPIAKGFSNVINRTFINGKRLVHELAKV